jgi:hypothetical protein
MGERIAPLSPAAKILDDPMWIGMPLNFQKPVIMMA